LSTIPFVGEAEVRHGLPARIAPHVRRVVAGNPGPYTYHGTCSYLVGQGQVAIIDPGPDDPRHVEAILAALEPGEHITHLVVTHTHGDHSPAARELRDRTGAPIYGFGPQLRIDDPDDSQVVFGDPDADPDSSEPRAGRGGDRDFRPTVKIRDGDVIEGDGWTLEAVHTPGHASNHLCYLFRQDGALFTGDHVMGWATSVISPPDGRLGEYLASLRRLLTRTQDRRYLPGHGPMIDDPRPFVRALLLHREERNHQILDVLRQGPATIAEIVPKLYAGFNKQLWPAAASSVHAHLIQLHEAGLVDTDDHGPLRRASRFKQVA
jgi:glyoxylase-like metal-dependent hydrolase (beta-lactamase superfamily II)